ncbi:MAG: N-6 DNA methylase [Marinoscillum sp.]
MSHPSLLLSDLYSALNYAAGDLIDISSSIADIEEQTFLSKGEWISACHVLNSKHHFKVDKLFFVQDNPVLVFIDASKVEKNKLFQVYNSVWSLARPRLVFIDIGNQINVFDLAADPAKNNSELVPLIDPISTITQITKKLQKFSREQVESGAVFNGKEFNTVNKRADQTLISDLKKVRKQLFDQGLAGEKLKYAHALIGRSIFIRYLEDRGVLTYDYFKQVASEDQRWLSILEDEPQGYFYRDEMRKLLYPRVLKDKAFTYALFKKIADDFNGDTFQTDSQEEKFVNYQHLHLLQSFLMGRDDEGQLSLFLWAYSFDVIPIDLISSIYEEFYHSENLIDKKTQQLKDGAGTHYTPSSLVEYSLSGTLNLEALQSNPKILDPACGSGIFLVESFRRIVRFHLLKRKSESLEVNQLLDILKNQIYGIDINEEAIKIAAFSLYLSFLHYLKPPSILDFIREGMKLPFFIFKGDSGTNHFNILLRANSFDDNSVLKVFSKNSFDIIVGNPPWGTPSTKDHEARSNLSIIEEWCSAKGLEFPDKEPSHAFIWRSLDFLKPEGVCNLLVSSGILFKYSEVSNAFKKRFLSSCTLEEIINFSHVRRVFFSEAISPFVLIKCRKKDPTQDSVIRYVTLKRSINVEKNKIVLVNKNDYKSILYHQTNTHDIWKIFYWGNSYDFNLISSIRRHFPLQHFVRLEDCGQGFQEANKANPSTWLQEYKEIPVRCFNHKYGRFDLNKPTDRSKLIVVPPKVKLRGKKAFYEGKRILIRRGILQSSNPKGQIIARLETDSFAYRHSLICIKLQEDFGHLYEPITAILWSSLFKYYMFMTASTWGTWMQEIHKNEVLKFPIPNLDQDSCKKLINIVRKLSESEPSDSRSGQVGLFDSNKNKQSLSSLESELDELVFDIYRLTDFERDLVMERCTYDIDQFYNGTESDYLKAMKREGELDSYIHSFVDSWSQYLDPGEKFDVVTYLPKRSSLAAVKFTLKNHDLDVPDLGKRVENKEIDNWFQSLDSSTFSKLSSNVFLEGMIRYVSDKDIIMIKRNQKRLWSKTEAKFDFDATLLQVLNS